MPFRRLLHVPPNIPNTDGTTYANSYDLTSLENPTADYAIVSSDNPQGDPYTYYYNFCAGTQGRGETWC